MVAIGIATKGRLVADLIAIGCFEDEAPAVERLPESLHEAALGIAQRPGWKGRDGQTGEAAVPSERAGRKPAGGRDQVVSLWGLGKRSRWDRRRLDEWLDGALLYARTNGARRAAVVPPEHAETQGEEAAARMIRRALLSEYRYDRYLQVPDLSQPRLGKILLVPAPGETRLFRGQLERGRAAAAAVTVARDLANAPANEATPRQLAEEMEGLALSHGFRCRVLGPKELKKRSMGGILAVGSGSRQPPCLVRLERGGEGPIVALVGKGVTFDSGGLSIKPADDMTSMKYDKAGACSVLGAALGAAQLKLRLRLRVYLPLAENMPGGGAYRPSDIVRCSNGKTVEIVNTDAEGRLLLADAMAWAVEEGAESLVELSTLTGGAVTALGDVGAPLFSGDDGLAEELLTAAGRAGERLWRMPLWPEFLDSMKGEHGDLRNSAGCSASPCTAAGFLAHFVGELKRWAHLDIAGTAQAGGTGAATGFGVPTLLGWLEEVAR